MCLALRATGLWLRYATLKNLIPSFSWIAPGWRGWGHKFCHLATLVVRPSFPCEWIALPSFLSSFILSLMMRNREEHNGPFAAPDRDHAEVINRSPRRPGQSCSLADQLGGTVSRSKISNALGIALKGWVNDDKAHYHLHCYRVSGRVIHSFYVDMLLYCKFNITLINFVLMGS